MASSHSMVIPPSVQECLSLLRSYAYINSNDGLFYIKKIHPRHAAGFILGVCARIPFLQDFVTSYINGISASSSSEVNVSDQYLSEIAENKIWLQNNRQASNYEIGLATPALLLAVLHSIYPNRIKRFDHYLYDMLEKISEMTGVEPLYVTLTSHFFHTMKNTLSRAVALKYRIMYSLFEILYEQHEHKWLLIKRLVAMQYINYQMYSFFAIGEWYEARQKTLAHIDPEVVSEMRLYEKNRKKMDEIVNGEYDIGAFRILNPFSTLPYLRQYSASAYCAISWKKANNPNRNPAYQRADRFGVDTKSFDQLLQHPIILTVKRKLKVDEILELNSKRIRSEKLQLIDY